MRFTMERITASNRPQHRYTYYVTGYGHFPFDMLRYDSAWPDRQTDAAKLERSDKQRSIRLVSYQEPTIGRWASFNWSVGNEELIT